jgi:hypothetical protein
VISLCNEVLYELDFAAQCALAKGGGYDGLEIAPLTLAEAPTGCPPRGAHAHPLPRAAGIMA